MNRSALIAKVCEVRDSDTHLVVKTDFSQFAENRFACLKTGSGNPQLEYGGSTFRVRNFSVMYLLVFLRITNFLQSPDIPPQSPLRRVQQQEDMKLTPIRG